MRAFPKISLTTLFPLIRNFQEISNKITSSISKTNFFTFFFLNYRWVNDGVPYLSQQDEVMVVLPYAPISVYIFRFFYEQFSKTNSE